MWGCVGRVLAVVPCWWSLCVCGVFSVAAELCILSSCWGWGRLLLSLFWCDCSAIFLGHLRFSAMCRAAGYPSGVPHLADSGWPTSSCSGGLAWGWGCLGTDVLLPHFGLLPCASAIPPSAASPSGFCALDGCVSMSDSSLLLYSWGWAGGIFAAPLGFLPCAVLFLRACSMPCFPCCKFPWGFQVTGCLSFCFPGDVGWASALPFFFYASPAPLACRGSRGYAPCVRVLQLRWCLLGLKVKSPCCPSLTLGWVCFWPAVSQAFVVRHGLGFVDAYSGRWMVQSPDVFLYLTLGSSLSLPVLAAGLRWLRFILGCPPSVASLWRGWTWFFIRYWLACPHGAAVPLDSWDRSPISGPSVFFLSPRPLRCFPSFGWVCFWS